ncbi:MAG: 2-oxoacid:acceptor oxidoreductase family protein [Deltaproteobacteria bacterium]|nr:2-oxoacid:acceptor oxidoreductase family protein [Deltaproteobacteria bacterium]
MEEITIIARGGQGAVTASQILAKAAFRDGFNAQTFPKFGAERRGAPVMAYIRIDQTPITTRSKVYTPDVVIVMDASLFKVMSPLQGLKDGGLVILNHPDDHKPPGPQLVEAAGQAYIIDATRLAHKLYGRTTIPITNVIITGAYSAANKTVSLPAIKHVLPDFFPSEALDKNIMAAELGFEGLRRIK